MSKISIGSKPVLYPTPVLIVSSYDREERPNAMAASWGGICCSNPPCVTISLRQATYTYHNIMYQRAYTINIPSVHYIKEADFFGNSTGRKTDKFAATGLTPIAGDRVHAPLIKEFPMNLECKVIHVINLGLHTQFVGEIKDIKADEAVLNAKGQPDIKKVDPFCYAPNRGGYFAIGDRLGSAYEIGNIFKT